MKALSMLAIHLALLLAGCHLAGERLGYNNWGWVLVDRERVCFSINKKEVISTYYIESNEVGHALLGSSMKHLSLTYPDTCFKIKLKPGYKYGAFYTLDGVEYRYYFFIDNNWNVVSLKGAN